MSDHVERSGRRTLAATAEHVAANKPNTLLCKTPSGDTISDGFTDLSVAQVVQSANHVARLLLQQVDLEDPDKVLLYMGPNDARYLVVLVACHKIGWKPLLSATSNSPEAHLSLMNQTNCTHVAYSGKANSPALALLSKRLNVRVIETPFLRDMLMETTVEKVSLDKSFDCCVDETAVIIHSSGTTGLPKPIHLTHGYLGAMDAQSHMSCPVGRHSAVPNQLTPDDLLLPTTSFSHMMGLFAEVMSIFSGVPFICSGQTGHFSSSLLLEIIRRAQPTAVILAPALAESVKDSKELLSALATPGMLCIGGAPLAQDIGQILSQKTQLTSVLGASEVGLVPSLIPEDPNDWEYFEWNPNAGVKMEMVDEELHELVIHRQESRDLQGVFHTFPALEEYRTKDLFSPHPTRHGLWKFQGRRDDIVNLSNGVKLNPTPMEKIIETHPHVSRAVVIGHGKPSVALLLEPEWDVWGASTSLVDLSAEVWPTVLEANKLVPPVAQIGRNRIGMASPQKPFGRTPKGSTQRRRVVQEYYPEIEEIYRIDACCGDLLRGG